jgi:hypothetical protein
MLDDFDKADAWAVFGEVEKNATYLNSDVGQLETVVSCILHHR